MVSSHDLAMTTVEGGSALSPFRARALLARLRAVDPEITDVTARFVHWVASEQPLTDDVAATVTKLLTYGEAYAGEPAPEGPRTLVVVGPRLGTISPWASKATDIVHNCGIDIRRVERVTEGPAHRGDVVQGDATVLVHQDAHDRAPAGRLDAQALQVAAGRLDDRSQPIGQLGEGGGHGVGLPLMLLYLPDAQQVCGA